MMHSLKGKNAHGEPSSRRDAFGTRDRELLDAWDRSNVPRNLDETVEQRLLAAYDGATGLSLEKLDAESRATHARMAEECEALIEDAADEFHEIAKQHEVYLRRIALRLCGDQETAKDLVQETLARALHRFGQFEHGTNARGWLVTILTRVYYDMLKHAHVISKAEDDLVTLSIFECELESFGIPDSQLWDAVKALEPDLRGVVERCYVQEMSYKAIADELKVPVGTIGTRLRRARERLRAILDGPDVTSA